MKKIQLFLSIVFTVVFLTTGITAVSAATMVTNEQLTAVKDAVAQQGDIKGLMQSLAEDITKSLMGEGYTPDEFRAAMAEVTSELISAIPVDSEGYASLVEQAFSGIWQGAETGIADAVAANSALDQAAYDTSAQNGLNSAVQEVSNGNPDLDTDALAAAVGGTAQEPEAFEPAEPEAFEPAQQAPAAPTPTPAPVVVDTPVIETPPTQDTTASPT